MPLSPNWTRLRAAPPVSSIPPTWGGEDQDYGFGIAVDDSGNTYLTGGTVSRDFPTLNQYQVDQDVNQVFFSAVDVFVAKLNPAKSGVASLLYSTYLWGESYDCGFGIAVDSSGNAYVKGMTYSRNFPTLNQYQVDPGDSHSDVFVTKLSFVAPPTVDTPTSSNITYTTATMGGNVSSTNGANVTERGVYWILSMDLHLLDRAQRFQRQGTGEPALLPSM